MKKNAPKDLTKNQSLLLAAISLGCAYILGSAALHTGSLWQYFFCLLTFIISVHYFKKAIKKDHRAKQK